MKEIKTQEELLQAIEHVHFASLKLCKRYFGRYLPVSGNLEIFTHFDDEFALLTQMRREITNEEINWNQKYFLLKKPITITDKRGDIPKTSYTYLYVRRPDKDKPQVGDVDLVLEKDEFEKLKNEVQEKKNINEVDSFYRPDLDMIVLSAQDSDVLVLITTKYMSENVKI